MKQLFLLIISLSLPGLFQAATFPTIIEKGDPRPILSIKKNTTTSLEGMRTKIQKQHGFFKQVALLRKVKRSTHAEGSYLQAIDPADKKAKQSLWVGIIALLFAMIPWYTIFAAIPLGIVALTMGNQAKQMGSKKMNGKGFGIAALALVALWFILVALFVAAFALSWGGIFAG